MVVAASPGVAPARISSLQPWDHGVARVVERQVEDARGRERLYLLIASGRLLFFCLCALEELVRRQPGPIQKDRAAGSREWDKAKDWRCALLAPSLDATTGRISSERKVRHQPDFWRTERASPGRTRPLPTPIAPSRDVHTGRVCRGMRDMLPSAC